MVVEVFRRLSSPAATTIYTINTINRPTQTVAPSATGLATTARRPMAMISDAIAVAAVATAGGVLP